MQNDQPDTRRQIDVLDPARARALQATLGQTPSLNAGDAVPRFFHQIYFWTPQPPDALGADGHPATGDALIPDFGLPQRMWAGGNLQWHQPLLLGRPADKVTRLHSAVQKQGKSGPLAFVELRHEYWQDNALKLEETQTLVYREDGPVKRPAPVSAQGRQPDRVETHQTDATLLFRYSALTFNGHRIHYDPEFAQGPGGYTGLVVHGPLLAQWLINLAASLNPALTTFKFRAVSPLIMGDAARVCVDPDGLWVEAASDRRLCMTAEAQ